MGAMAAETSWLLASTGARAEEFYAAIGVALPRSNGREAAVSCFANAAGHNRDDRDPSCSVNLLTGLWHCKGCGLSGNAYQAALSRGYDEQRARELAQQHGLFLERVEDKPKLPGERQLKKWRKALLESPLFLARLAELKGWTPAAIVRCGLGWDGERITFPIRSRRLSIVGCVRYLPGGTPKAKAMFGSKRLLFPAPEVMSTRRPLFLVEGEPDAVSVRSCGHQAVAIAGTGSWRPEFAARLAGHDMVFLPDCDFQGRELASRVASSVPSVRVVDLEPGRNDGYDIGDMVRDAAADGGVQQMGSLLTSIAGGAA